MLTRFKYQVIFLYFVSFFLLSSYVFAVDKSEDKQAIIWASGPYMHFKYAPQDAVDKKNAHPVTLSANDINYALTALRVQEKGFFGQQEKIKPVFSFQQMQLLGQHLADSLQEASPDQDIVFVLEGVLRSTFGIRRSVFLAGRAFYQDNKLNIILGDYDKSRNDAFEMVYDPSGQIRIPYAFRYGSRLKNISKFKEQLVAAPGIENKKRKKLRHDWFLLDVARAAAAVLAEKNRKDASPTQVLDLTVQQQLALEKERRAMRVEMARMRKEMQSLAEEQPTKKRSPEERMLALNALLEKKLISQQEYERKRQAILDEI